MEDKYDLFYILVCVLVIIAVAVFTKIIWESNLPDWLKIFLLRQTSTEARFLSLASVGG